MIAIKYCVKAAAITIVNVLLVWPTYYHQTFKISVSAYILNIFLY